jgi:hypothetical protein
MREWSERLLERQMSVNMVRKKHAALATDNVPES